MISTPRDRDPRVLLAPDSFKGSVGSVGVCDALAAGVLASRPEINVRRLPMADGGEGTVSAIASACPGTRLDVREARGPLGDSVDATLLWMPGGDVAVMEVASVAGLQLVASPDPSSTSTWGVGELLAVAMEAGARRILVGVGGSATVDGGAGALQALGYGLFDGAGAPIAPGVLGLESLHEIEPPPIAPLGVELLCDVQSPLLGPRGAARQYGPQKGATPELVDRAEVALERFAERLSERFGRDPRGQPGAGAAGGLAGGLWSACGAVIRTGVHVVADLVHLEEEVAAADLVITGEGCLDGQTGEGKLVAGIQDLCARHGAPLVAVVGQATEVGRSWCDQRGVHLIELGEPTQTIEERIRRAPELLERAGRQLMERLTPLG